MISPHHSHPTNGVGPSNSNWLWDLVDCMRHEEEKIAGNTRDRGEKQGRARIRAEYFEPALVV